MRSISILPVLFCVAYSAPKLRTYPQQHAPQLMTLPSNATVIRTEITDSFDCEGREYGYYADVENDCQIFHVCLPVRYSDGRNLTFRWSFICPEETVFNQEIFTCTRSDESIPCSESPRFYNLNTNIGEKEPNKIPEEEQIEDATLVPEVPQQLERKNPYDTKRRKPFF